MNETHASTTNPDARLFREWPGMEVRPAFPGHALMENRSGLIVDARPTEATGLAERIAAPSMIESHTDRPRAITLGADRGHDAEDFVDERRAMNVLPHGARNSARRGDSAMNGRTTRHESHAASLRIRKHIEEGFGWMKSVAGLDRPMLRGCVRVGWAFTFAAAASDFVRLPELPAVLP